MMTIFFYLAVSFLASVVGGICGIGGGVIIKPVLDAVNMADVSTVSFLSSCTVLSMSCYSVGKALSAGDSLVEFQTGTPLAIGGAIGGIWGKNLFSMLRAMADNPERVGGYQAICLAGITAATLVYTIFESRIHTHQVKSPIACGTIGLVLGLISSFLGIGGGPINLVVLYYFFSMDTKTAAANSLYVILFSQAASFLMTLITGTVPEFTVITLVLMVIGGILGGMIGRKLNKRLESRTVDRLFIGLMALIILISCYNVWQYAA